MPSVPKELIEHCLKVDPKATPKKQQLRRFASEKMEAIKKDLAKLLTTGLLKKSTTQSGYVTPDLQGHKPSNHICDRINSRIYTTELSRYHNTYHEIKAYKF
jgi:hypothetical protein